MPSLNDEQIAQAAAAQIAEPKRSSRPSKKPVHRSARDAKGAVQRTLIRRNAWRRRLRLLVAVCALGAALVLFGPLMPPPYGDRIAEVLSQLPIEQVATLAGREPTPLPGEAEPVPEPEWASIPATRLVLGDAGVGDALPGKGPLEVPAFQIMKTEVSIAQFKAGCATELLGRGCKGWEGPVDGQGADHPAVGVSWTAAQAWCEAKGWRLPTEAEWEVAARGKAGRPYPWGKEWLLGAVNYCDKGCPSPYPPVHDEDDGYFWTAPVESMPKGATPEGVLHMAGNAAEWTLDCWTPNHRDRVSWLPSPGPCDRRTARGGSWKGWAKHQVGWHRRAAEVERPGDEIGFRCVQGEPISP